MTASPDIRARLVVGPPPKLGRYPKIFDTGESWAMYRSGASRWVSFHPPARPEPHYVARFDRTARRAVVTVPRPKKEGRRAGAEIDNPLAYPLDQILTMYHLAGRRGLIVHAAGIALNGRTLLFAGCSGAGKSTLARLFASFGTGEPLSDERMIVRVPDPGRGFAAYGTPWAGTELIARPGGGPLAALFFLKHGTRNRVVPLAPREALDRLLPACSIPWYDGEVMAPIVATCKEIVARTPVFRYEFKPDRSAPAALLKFAAARSLA